MPKTKSTSKKRSRESGTGPRGIAAAVATDGLVDLVQKLGLAELLIDQIKSRFAEQDLDELVDDAKDYLSRNPEVLVISLGALTIATGMVVWLQQRRQWDGHERRDLKKAS